MSSNILVGLTSTNAVQFGSYKIAKRCIVGLSTNLFMPRMTDLLTPAIPFTSIRDVLLALLSFN